MLNLKPGYADDWMFTTGSPVSHHNYREAMRIEPMRIGKDTQHGYVQTLSKDGSLLVYSQPNADEDPKGNSGVVHLVNLVADPAGIENAIIPPVGSDVYQFGRALAVSDKASRIAIAAISKSDKRGTVFVYKRSQDGSRWRLEQTFRQSDEILNAYSDRDLGIQMAFSADGKTLVMLTDIYWSRPHFATEMWTVTFLKGGKQHVVVDEINLDVEAAVGKSKLSMAMSGNGLWLAIGVANERENYSHTSGVYTFRRGKDKKWKVNDIFALTDMRGEEFGYDISLSHDGRVLLVGAPNAAADRTVSVVRTGVIYAYRYSPKSGRHILKQVLFPTDSKAAIRFGDSLDIDKEGEYVVVGTSYSYDSAKTSGQRVYTFQYDGQRFQPLGSTLSNGVNIGAWAYTTSVSTATGGLFSAGVKKELRTSSFDEPVYLYKESFILKTYHKVDGESYETQVMYYPDYGE
jgi:hypothetical protein